MNDKVSIITVNYNGFADTCELIESLLKNENHPYELIVVDNASKQREDRMLKEKYPAIVTIRSDQNLGFAGGNNLGIKQATGKYLFFLNNDTIISQPVLSILIKRLESDKKIGCVSPKLVCWPETKRIQYAGTTPMSLITLRNQAIGYQQIDNGQFDEAQETTFAHGAAMIIRSSDIEKYGIMPEYYFLYYEELDWCTYMHKAGFSIWYEPLAKIGHKESASVGQQSPLQVYYHTRSRFIYAQRTIDKKTDKITSYIYQSTIVFLKRFITYVMNNQVNLITPLIKGTMSGLIFVIKNNTYGKLSAYN